MAYRAIQKETIEFDLQGWHFKGQLVKAETYREQTSSWDLANSVFEDEAIYKPELGTQVMHLEIIVEEMTQIGSETTPEREVEGGSVEAEGQRQPVRLKRARGE